ncbi:Uncharacterized membrane protein YeaQ/YmgE, transglycosylase-associated protein family [Variovorax sp. NFACC28]|nr:Uncharacterized membrane protein YeaQ/YmgE, transglycosylase-associated protein family [Variovorax sp. NFACC28]SEG95495.1 Uncharacterized membrane protein YeaQ/YmgE, transglycosylase-associated protein family [Variovorax sp. NFACC29]SFD77532.1 Uncharacterized membrane protein YeaQ/YmgE, transglycosylase-associated protein family [Variovorax sp. NFACC26]SFG92104.1 Uncharacterized membrane protein YeaQ/YmgE, transglycosylase-associated protein family [Variovorax sp. NFACC27]
MLPLSASALATARVQDGTPSVAAQEGGATIPGRLSQQSGGACCHQGQGVSVHIIWTILIGFIAGLLARAVLPGNNSMGFILTAVLGIAGSLVATYAGQAMGWYAAGAGAGFIASVVGAAVLLGIWHLVTR